MEYGRLILHRSTEPIREPVTKFGGLPAWVDKPAWPRSAATGAKMLFIGQVEIDPRLFPVTDRRIAYLFITDNPDLETWDPESGENAVIIQVMQPGHSVTIVKGPTLNEMYWEEGDDVGRERPLELAAEVVIEPQPDLTDEEIDQLDEEAQKEYFSWLGQSIGGKPDWIQNDEVPDGWPLLLQIGEWPRVAGKSIVPTWNFGTGNCYVLISPDCSKGILLWQCT
ncbi:MAG: DUF1963 domain-containing protein [Bryobacteraceae bacterium]